MEGPQTRVLADLLNEQLTGKPVERILVPEHRWQANVLLINCVGQVIQRVRSHGKWIFFDFSHGVTWLCQLITRATWSVQTLHGEQDASQAPRDRRSKRPPLLAVHFRPGHDGAQLVATLRGRPIFFIVPTEKVRQHPEIRLLGPDPIGSPAFTEEFPFRLRQNPMRSLAAALLDQHVIAGVGNMLKCEILYAERLAPSTRIADMLASQIDHLAATIVALAATATTFAAKGEPYPYRVYDRAGLPCSICNAEITVDRSAEDGHLTWYCPSCQPQSAPPTLFAGREAEGE